MTPENAVALKAHLQAIAAILYEETPPETLNTLEEIEQTVRQKVLKRVKLVGRKLPPHRLYVSPEIGVFLFNPSQVQPQAEKDA